MSKDTDDDQQVTLDDAAEQAFDSIESGTPAEPKLATPEAAPEPEFEVPAWAKMWSEPARNALKAIGGIQHNKGHLDPILKQIEETNGYITKRDTEYADYRKAVDPVYEVLKPLEQVYRLQGQSLQQGVSQLVEGAQFVARDPDQAFPYFAGMYQPRNPTDAVLGIAKAWGVDLGQIAQEQPYIDPTVQALVSPLQKQLQELQQQQSQARQAQEQAERQQQQATQKAIVDKLASLEVQKDESGNLRFPHLAAAWEDIVLLANTGRYQTIEDAYDRAVLMNPALAESVTKAAEAKAVQEAKARSEQSQKEAQANRSVAGKGRKSDQSPGLGLNAAAEKAADMLGI